MGDNFWTPTGEVNVKDGCKFETGKKEKKIRRNTHIKLSVQIFFLK